MPGGALVFAGMVVAAISYGGWYFFSTSETVIDLTPGIPDRLSFLLEEPAIRRPVPRKARTLHLSRLRRSLHRLRLWLIRRRPYQLRPFPKVTV